MTTGANLGVKKIGNNRLLAIQESVHESKKPHGWQALCLPSPLPHFLSKFDLKPGINQIHSMTTR